MNKPDNVIFDPEKDPVYFNSHDFDWEHPEITTRYTDYICKNCRTLLIQHYIEEDGGYNPLYSLDTIELTCNEIIMINIL